jgi:hypothetical protein
MKNKKLSGEFNRKLNNEKVKSIVLYFLSFLLPFFIIMRKPDNIRHIPFW